ncbi:hypothetical protein BC1002_0074 [Paraburkholderia atlantica]|uniref:Uncharacterized protein n=1 Tax=Paraburkholderia atlantica TaxID=2654982 RepID=D5W9W3_PARAM|nr:hypothetical protein BC1002_0074 [Paraburkholderia atlantica]
MERRDGASVRVGAYSQAAEPRRSGRATIGAAQQNPPESTKRSLTQAFRFSADPRGMGDCVRLFASAQVPRRDQADSEQRTDQPDDPVPAVTGPHVTAIRADQA